MAATIELQNVYSALPSLLSISPHAWIDYDEAADVLYIGFRKPQQATDSVMEDNVVYHHDGGQIVGISIIGARATLAQTPTQKNN